MVGVAGGPGQVGSGGAEVWGGADGGGELVEEVVGSVGAFLVDGGPAFEAGGEAGEDEFDGGGVVGLFGDGGQVVSGGVGVDGGDQERAAVRQ